MFSLILFLQTGSCHLVQTGLKHTVIVQASLRCVVLLCFSYFCNTELKISDSGQVQYSSWQQSLHNLFVHKVTEKKTEKTWQDIR